MNLYQSQKCDFRQTNNPKAQFPSP
jgi:hypothetical protein